MTDFKHLNQAQQKNLTDRIKHSPETAIAALYDYVQGIVNTIHAHDTRHHELHENTRKAVVWLAKETEQLRSDNRATLQTISDAVTLTEQVGARVSALEVHTKADKKGRAELKRDVTKLKRELVKANKRLEGSSKKARASLLVKTADGTVDLGLHPHALAQIITALFKKP